MLICEKCSWQSEGSKFCTKCGGVMAEGTGEINNNLKEKSDKDIKYSKFFMEPTEKFICALGNSLMQNFLLRGEIKNGFSVVSDKRVYFKGKCFYSDGGKYKLREEERVVDVKDVTGTGCVYINPFQFHIPSTIVSLISLFVILICFASGEIETDEWAFAWFASAVCFFTSVVTNLIYIFAHKVNVFEIIFAGGKIAFNTIWYSKSEVDNFQRQLRLMKDKVSEDLINAHTRTVPVVPIVQSSLADELKKFADLLEQGAITQEEYDKIKEDLLMKR